jgi:hypothetical protein
MRRVVDGGRGGAGGSAAVRSRIGYWIGAGLIAAGILGAITWAGVIADGLVDKIARFQHVAVPGRGDVRLEDRKYVVYVEGPGADARVPPIELVVTDPARETRLELRPYNGSLTYSFNADGSAVGTLTPPRAGVYRVRADGPGGYRVVIGETISRDLVRAGGGAVVIGAGGGIAGVLLLIATGVRRSRAAAQPAGS